MTANARSGQRVGLRVLTAAGQQSWTEEGIPGNFSPEKRHEFAKVSKRPHGQAFLSFRGAMLDRLTGEPEMLVCEWPNKPLLPSALVGSRNAAGGG